MPRIAGRGASFRYKWAGVITVLLAAIPTLALSGTVHQVLNINTNLVAQGSYPQYLGSLGGKMLLAASDATGGGLWSTDGTSQGTTLVRRLTVTAQTTFPGTPNFLIAGGHGYFVGDDGNTGAEPWVTDGTAAGTVLLADLAPGKTGSNPVFSGLLGSQILFSATDGSGSGQLYVSDGTTAGTQALTAFAGVVGVVNPSQTAGGQSLFVGNKFYFVATTGSAREIWVTDGTVAGTHSISTFANNTISTYNALYNPHSFTVVGNLLLYMSDGGLWSIDMGTATIDAVATPNGTLTPGVNENAPLAGMGGFALYLAFGNSPNSVELWRTDGTATGTYRVAVADPGPGSFSEVQGPFFRQVGNRVLFIGKDSQYGLQLWSSDGTAANTMRLTAASEPANSAFQIAVPVAVIAGTAYVAISDGAQTTTWSIWRTDGTPGGTVRVNGVAAIDQSEAGNSRMAGDGTTIYVEAYGTDATASLYKYDPAANASTLLSSHLMTYLTDGFLYNSGALYLSVNGTVTGDEPWLSDGTAAGTHIISDIYPESTDQGSNPDEFVTFNGALAFVADDGVHGRELWQSDGTAAGTTLLADINPGPADSNPSNLFVANGSLYFFATDSNGAHHLMSLSAPGAQPQSLATVLPAPAWQGYQPGIFAPPCSQTMPVVLNGTIFFSANDGVSGVELWSTDGTPAGTGRVADINPNGDSNPCFLTVVGSRVFFAATSANGNELWSSDGTASGTVQVADIAPGSASSAPFDLTVFNGALYFGASNGTTGRQIWVSDGTASGTRLFAQLVPNDNLSVAAPVGVLNGKLLLEGQTVQSQQPYTEDNELWISDGTTTGTAKVGGVPSTFGFASSINGGSMYFSGPGSVGPEPWITDGTTAGTRLLKDINPTANSTIPWFEGFHSDTLFAVTDPSFGEQLWRIAGSTAATTLIAAVPVDPGSSVAYQYTQYTPARHRLTVGHNFFFAGTDSTAGTELYAWTTDAPVATADTGNSPSDQPVTLNVLANDTDTDGIIDPSTLQITTNPSHGTVTVSSGGTVTYTPTSGFGGTDTFAYTVSDKFGATSAPATATISVTAASVTVTSGKGGGGALDLVSILGLAIALWRLKGSSVRRVQRHHVGRADPAGDSAAGWLNDESFGSWGSSTRSNTIPSNRNNPLGPASQR